MPLRSLSISLALVLLLLPATLKAQSYPSELGDRARYEFAMEMKKGYVSGILIMVRTSETTIDASIVNEFGLSLIDFTYDEKKDKVKLHSVLKKLDKWYIKRVLKNDLKQMLRAMRNGQNEYYDKRHKIKYIFTLIDETQE